MDDTDRRDLILEAENKIQSIAYERTAVNETIGHLNLKITEIGAELSALKNRLNEVDNLPKIENDILSIISSIDEIKKTSSSISLSQETAKKEIQNIKNKIEEMHSHPEKEPGPSPQTVINDMNTIQGNFTRGMDRLQQTSDRLEESMKDFPTIRIELMNILNSLQNKFDSLEGSPDQTSDILTNIQTLKTQIDDVNNDLSDRLQSISSIQSQIDQIYNSVDHIKVFLSQFDENDEGDTQTEPVDDGVSLLRVEIDQINSSIEKLQEIINQQSDYSQYVQQTDKKLSVLHGELFDLADTMNKFIYIMLFLFVIGILCLFLVIYLF